MTSANEKPDPLTARGIKLQGEYFADCNLLVDVIAKDMEAYEELKKERDALVAQLERLRSATYGMLVNRTGMDEWYDLEKAYRETHPLDLQEDF